ncbi:MAG TPA: hypothetical protein VF519_07465 [Mycobacteriales bacterium]
MSRRAFVAVLLLALLGGCSDVRRAGEVANAVRAGGYDVTGVTFAGGPGGDVVRVAWRPRRGEDPETADRGIARIVWERADLRLDGVVLERVDSRGPVVTSRELLLSRAELESAFGPRDPRLDEHGLSDPSGLLGPVLGLLALAGVVSTVLLVVLVRRTKRAQARPPAGPPSGGSWGGPSGGSWDGPSGGAPAAPGGGPYPGAGG